MPQVSLMVDAEVPEGTTARVTVREESQKGEDRVETKEIRTGRHRYLLESIEGKEGNAIQCKIELDTDDIEKTAKIAHGIAIDIAKKEKTPTEPDPSQLEDKVQELEYFFEEVCNSKDPEILRYNLTGYLGAVFTIDETLRDIHSFDTWAGDEFAIDLHDYMLDRRRHTDHLRTPSWGIQQPPVEERVRGAFFSSKEDSSSETSLSSQLFFPKIHESVWEHLSSTNDFTTIYIAGEKRDVRNYPKWRALPARRLLECHLSLVKQWVNESVERLEN